MIALVADTIRTLVIPQILEDSRRVMSTWGYSGSLDPFQHLSEVRTPPAYF